MEQEAHSPQVQEPNLQQYLTTLEQSKFLAEKKVKIHNIFFHVREGEEWFIDQETAQADEFYPAFMLEELKSFLPFHMVTTKMLAPIPDKPNTFYVQHWCSADPRQPSHEGIQSIVHPLRELDAVYFMIAHLLEQKRMDPEKPMLLRKPLIHTGQKTEAKIIPLN
jgi:hypothetical protein